MGTTTHILLYLIVGAAGGFIGWRLKIAGGIIIGSMLAVIIFKLLVQRDVEIPGGLRFFIQVLLGVMVGSTFRPEILHELRTMVWPVVLSTIVLMGSGLITAVVLARFGVLDTPTAYIATSPGAMSTLIGLATESGANATLVLLFHVFRLTSINLTAPLIFALLAWWTGR